MPLSQIIARLVTQGRPLVWTAAALLSAACIFILVTRLRLDTEVLNLLPKGFESVEGLKVYNHDFAQTRELTFALLCQPGDVDKLEEFAPRLRKDCASNHGAPASWPAHPDRNARGYSRPAGHCRTAAFEPGVARFSGNARVAPAGKD